jgi:hypothetical protein
VNEKWAGHFGDFLKKVTAVRAGHIKYFVLKVPANAVKII